MFVFYVAPRNRFSLDRWRIINAFIIFIIVIINPFASEAVYTRIFFFDRMSDSV